MDNMPWESWQTNAAPNLDSLQYLVSTGGRILVLCSHVLETKKRSSGGGETGTSVVFKQSMHACKQVHPSTGSYWTLSTLLWTWSTRCLCRKSWAKIQNGLCRVPLPEKYILDGLFYLVWCCRSGPEQTMMRLSKRCTVDLNQPNIHR